MSKINTHWTQYLTNLKDGDHSSEYLPVVNGILDLTTNKHFLTLDNILNSHHPRYLAINTSVIILQQTYRYRNKLKHFDSFLYKVYDRVLQLQTDSN